MKNLIRQDYDEKKTRIFEKLQSSSSKISITSDGWSSQINMLPFISTTAHFYDENIKKVNICLGLDYFPHPHTGDKIAEKWLKKFEEFEICDKIISLTTDNASNMIKAVTDLNSLLRETHNSENNLEHIFCSSHCLNLIVKEGFDVFNKSKDFSQTLDKLRGFIRKIRKSSLMKQTFKLKAKECGEPQINLKLDVVTRWNSTYDMLNRAKTLRKTINLMTSEYFYSLYI